MATNSQETKKYSSRVVGKNFSEAGCYILIKDDKDMTGRRGGLTEKGFG